MQANLFINNITTEIFSSVTVSLNTVWISMIFVINVEDSKLINSSILQRFGQIKYRMTEN